MAWIPQDITPTELALLRVLWNRGDSTIRDLTDTLYDEGTHSQYATVQSLLDRLEKKDCVARRRQGRVNVFRATVSRGELVGRRLREVADNLCDGSLAPLLSHLVDKVELSQDELATLQHLVDRLDGEASTEEEA
jgi:predicted transcriptional regulator